MRSLPAVLMFSLALSVPVLGQHMGQAGHAGNSARAGVTSRPVNGGFHGGFATPAAHSFPSTPWYPWNGVVDPPVAPRNNFAGSSGRAPYLPARSGQGLPNHREPYRRDHDRDHDRRANRGFPSFANGVYLTPGWIGPGLWGYPDMFGYGSDDTNGGGDTDLSDNARSAAMSGAYPNEPSNEAYSNRPYANESYAPSPPPPPDAERAPRPAYVPDVRTVPPVAQAKIDDRPAVTLIFWDLRPNQEIHDYLLTPKTLYVFDGGRRREIPVVDIDVVATQQANQESGVDFTVPAT